MQLSNLAVILGLLVGSTWAQTQCDFNSYSGKRGYRRRGYNPAPDSTVLEQCLQEVSTAASSLTNSPVDPGADLSVYISAKFYSRPEPITACCTTLFAERSCYKLNPLVQDAPNNYLLRQPPKLNFYIEDGAGVAVGDGNLYTLLVLDLDSTVAPWAHWVVVDIPGLDVRQGRVEIPYFSPAVNVNHMFVLYNQSQPFTGNISTYGQIGNPANPAFALFCPAPGRCNFNLDQFVQDLDLQLLGATWVKPTEVSTFTYYMRLTGFGLTEAATCSAVDGVTVSGDNIECPATTTSSAGTNVRSGRFVSRGRGGRGRSRGRG